MMMNRIFFALLLLPALCAAQPDAIKKIATQASTESLKKNLYALASDEMGGRLMASHGDTLASLLIAENFKQQNLEAPFDGGTSFFQSITTYKQNDKQALTFNGKTYAELEGWNLAPASPLNLVDVTVINSNFTTIDQWLENIPNMQLEGKAVIFSEDFLAGDVSKLDSLEGLLYDKGVKLMIWSSPNLAKYLERRKAYNFLPRYSRSAEVKTIDGMPEVALTTKLMTELLAADKGKVKKGKPYFYELKTRLNVLMERTMDPVQAPNVIGVIKGADPEADCVILSAHHDHDGRNGKILYPGAVDNASGSAAIMEVAALMNAAAKEGLKPKRSIVFASYTGEERGLLGSHYLADHPVFPISKTYGVINIDMLGRVDTLHANGRNPDSNYAYILVKDSVNHGLRNSLFKANEAVKLTLDTYYENPKYAQRRIKGSDQYPFYELGVPFVRIDCGFAKEYHRPEDTPDKIDYNLLTRQTQLVFLTLWNMAND